MESRKCIHQGAHSKVFNSYGNEAFLGARRVNPFDFQKFNLNIIAVYRNGDPVSGTPLQIENDKKLYLNSLEALASGQDGHGVPYNDYANHYILVFYLTSTQPASHDYLYPGLTIGSISFSLRFSAQLTNSVEVEHKAGNQALMGSAAIFTEYEV